MPRVAQGVISSFEAARSRGRTCGQKPKLGPRQAKPRPGRRRAEAVLRLRALISNGDFDTYWTWHLAREHHRTHLTHYQGHTLAA